MSAVRSRRHEIAFYAPWAGPTLTPVGRPTGGAEVQVLHLARNLARRGHRVKIVTYATAGLPDRVDGITVVPQWRASGRRTLPRYVATLASSLYRLLALGAPVVVQRSAGATTGLVALTARLARRRFVYSSASTIEFTFDRAAYPFAGRGLFALGVRLADEVVVQTTEQAQLCVERFGRRPVIIRSVAEPAPPLPPDARPAEGGLLWIGRLVASKNPTAFLDLAAAVPDVPCTLVYVPSPADPPGTLETIERRAEQLPNVTLLGPQPRVAMLDRIARATAIVSTSDHEGMPNTLLEGWSRGVPALTLAHDPDGIIEREGIGHCAAGDPAALAAHARTVWNGRGQDHALRDACRAYVRREHDPDVVLDRWAAVLRLSAPADRASDPDARPGIGTRRGHRRSIRSFRR